jgi:diadenosine tetraphosphate (Ap4A) HIT family hydrolase
MNQTMEKFGYPETLIREYSSWSVQLRPKQATLGSLVAICNEPVRSFGQLSGEAFAELKQVTAEMEAALGSSFGYAKINYLMLMMTDPDVHFHILPRYSGAQQFCGISFVDPGWPGPPDISFETPTDKATRIALIELMRSRWP